MRAATPVLAALAALACLAPPAGAGSPAPPRDVARNAFGQPDLEGVWTNASLTRLERDLKIGRDLVMTPAQADRLERQTNDYVVANNKPTDPKAGVEYLNTPCRAGQVGPQCGYNAGWIDPGSTVMRVNGERRSSFITSEPDGQVPPLTPQARARLTTQMAAYRGPRAYDGPEARPMGERCIVSFGNSAGPVMLPLLYNNNYQIVQTRDEVAIVVEMVHDVRHIRLNASHLPADVRPWLGDSIGRWEGDTLVVETTNYHPQQSFRGSDENLKVTERLTRAGPGRLRYAFWVEDPTVWLRPWGGEYEFRPGDGRLYEYACHEGNYALHGILAGARENERKGLPPGGDGANVAAAGGSGS